MQEQDPKFLILNALIQGATPAISKIVSDAYNLLKSRIEKKFKNNPGAQDTFNQFQANPDANYLAMGDVLEQTGVTRDQVALNHAQTIIYNINNIAYGQGSSIIQGSGKVRIGPDTRTNNPWPVVLLGTLALIGIVAYLFFSHVSSLFQTPKVVLQSAPTVVVKRPTPPPTPTPPPPTPTPMSTSIPPIDTMTAFCNTINKDSVYQELYSSTLRRQVTPAQFNDEWGSTADPLSSCIPIISSGSKTTGTLAVTRFFSKQHQIYNFTLIKEGGLWKIDSLQLQ